MPTSELHNVERPVSARVCAMSTGRRENAPGAGLIEFEVPRHVAEAARLGEVWYLSRRSPDAPA